MRRGVGGFFLGMIFMFLLVNVANGTGMKHVIFSLVNIEANGRDKYIS